MFKKLYNLNSAQRIQLAIQPPPQRSSHTTLALTTYDPLPGPWLALFVADGRLLELRPQIAHRARLVAEAVSLQTAPTSPPKHLKP